MRFRPLVALPVLVLMAACGDSSSDPTSQPTAAAQVGELGTAAEDGADESLGAMLDDVSGGFASLSNPSPCPTITASFTNTPVPTASVVAEFGVTPEALGLWPPAADDPCLKSRDAVWVRPMGLPGALKVYVFGRLEKSASGTLDTAIEWNEALTDLGYVATLGDFSDFHRAQRNGTRHFARNTSGIVASEDLVTARTRRIGDATVSNAATATLDWTFTPDAGGVIQPGTLRPDGTITVEGSWSFSGQVFVRQDGTGPVVQDVDVGFAVTTVSPLVYDAGCTGRPRDRIASGQLRFTRTRGDQAVSFTLTWNGCGQGPVKAQA